MWNHIGLTVMGFVLTYFVIFMAASMGGSFTPGAGGIIGFSVGFSRIYTRDNSMFSWSMWFLLIGCILGGSIAGFQV